MRGKGSSSIEILIALVVFQLAALIVLQGQLKARQQVVLAQQQLVATALLADIAASVQQMPALAADFTTPLNQPLLPENSCQHPDCSSLSQARTSLMPVLARAFQTGYFSQPQLCLSGHYPFLHLHFSWRSPFLKPREVGQGQCQRYGRYQQVQLGVGGH